MQNIAYSGKYCKKLKYTDARRKGKNSTKRVGKGILKHLKTFL